jgi:hypothetical protein
MRYSPAFVKRRGFVSALSTSRQPCADLPLLPLQDLLVEVFTAEMPGGALEASELQGTLEATQVPQLNITVDDPQLKVWERS